jgi:putative hydrolase of the HAD superfamily
MRGPGARTAPDDEVEVVRVTALVLDFGGPVIRTPFELRHLGEQAAGLPPGTLTWQGPFDPDSDADWGAMQSGVITEREYWRRRVDEFAALTGAPATYNGLFAGMYSADEAELVRPEAVALIGAARRRGMAVAVLTNDLRAFHGPEWIDRMSVLKSVDLIVDGSIEGVLKPDPAIYGLLTDRLDVAPEDCLFVDDQPGNVAGARAVGMTAVWFDITDPAASFAAVHDALDAVDG